jgi:cation-transporting ATPase E
MNSESIKSGLSSKEVAERIARGLVNKSKEKSKYSVVKIVIENSLTAFNLINIMILGFLLFYYLRTGDYKLLYDSIGVISVTIFNTAAGIFQKIKAAKALEKVELMQRDTITVVRDGSKLEIHTEDIVKDDIVFIQKGDQVPVDGTMLQTHHLQIDESLLTGESLPNDKGAGDEVYSGSFCVYGNGYMLAEKVGDENMATQITHLAKKYKLITSPLMKKINWIFFISFIITIIMVVIEFIISDLAGNISVSEIRKISTIAFSLIPEGLVFFATVTFTVGIYRISKMGAIVQKINAIDSFSTIKVVCMDKTGTITKNNIKVAKITPFPEAGIDLESAIGTYAGLSSEQNATVRALEEYKAADNFEMLDEMPFRSDLKMSVLKIKINGETNTFVLGAYDILTQKLSPGNIEKSSSLFAGNDLKGYRNLLFGLIDTGDLTKLEPDDVIDKEITPLCIISMKDEAREDAADALRLFEENHIKVKIVSGDSSDSVLSTLSEINWQVSDSDVINGAELEQIDDETFDNIVKERTIFTRLKPEHKLKIVRSLRKQHIQTAVIGDGVNDLPAIKEADLGITMENGSTITKQVSDIVLLDNKFSILPGIFKEGNKIINTVKFVGRLYLTKNNVIFILSLLSWFFAFTYPLTPRRSSLISVLGVGIPCYLIALYNKNSHAYPSFFRDLFIYVGVASLMIIGAAFGAYYSTNIVFGVSGDTASKLMLVSLVILMIFNFFTAVYFDDPENKKRYGFYAFSLFAVFLIFTIFKMDVIPLSWLRTFYELKTTTPQEWFYLLVTLFPAAIIFLTVQYFRHKWMMKYFYKNMFVKKF